MTVILKMYGGIFVEKVGKKLLFGLSSAEVFVSREREIVTCMKLRMTDDEIASRFNLSRKTVSTHRRNILSKLGIRNRNELYKYLFGLSRLRDDSDGRLTSD
ncbi:TPA: helix-turn-helix transcriptional regulator [Escherichia coli]|nr:helix-turn-helix transcriptional regulator [Escherichia coli]